MLKTYRGSCSICRRTRFWPAVVRAEGFRLLAGDPVFRRGFGLIALLTVANILKMFPSIVTAVLP